MNENYCSIIQIYVLSVSMHVEDIEHKQNSDIDEGP